MCHHHVHTDLPLKPASPTLLPSPRGNLVLSLAQAAEADPSHTPQPTYQQALSALSSEIQL